MPTYTKTAWVNGTAPAISATNLNKLELGIEKATAITGYGTADTTAWTATTTAGFGVMKNVPITGITTDMLPSVRFTTGTYQTALNANVSLCESYDGGIRLYGDSAPASTLAFDYYCIKGNISSPARIEGLFVWLDASDETTMTLSGSNISQWRDKSGNGRHASQATTAHQPTYNAASSTLNLRRTVQSGSGTSMALSFNGATLSPPYSIFAVAKENPGSAGGYMRILSGNTASTTDGNLFFGTYQQKTATFFGTGGTWPDGAAANNPFHYNTTIPPAWIQCVIHGDGSASPYMTGYTQDVRNGYSHTLTSTTLFSSGSDFSFQNFEGFVGEIFIYNRSVTSAERQLLEGYLAWKWNIVNYFPSTHPYFNIQP